MARSRKDPFASLYGDVSDRLAGNGWSPPVDVFETDGEVRVRMEVAGVNRNAVRVTVQGDQLRIHGERTPPPGTEVHRHHQMEIAFGPFERTVSIPVPFQRDHVVARLEEGFLTVTLPKQPKVRRRIDVGQGEER